MTPDKDLQLANKYPKIFKYYARTSRPRPADDTWGFECGDGWYQLLDALCGCIQNRVDHLVRDPSKFTEEELESVQVVACIIKEKFGGLRFDHWGGDDEISGMITMAESMSYRICEGCGSPGSHKGDGWAVTMCDDCWKKREEARASR